MRNFTHKFNSLFDLQSAFPTEKSCIKFLEQIRWHGNVISPFDPTSKVYKRSDGSYRCKNTGKNFNVRIGTIFESSKLPLRKWFMAIYILTSNKKGISSMQLAKDLHITQKTAWFLTQRIRETFTIRTNDKLTGEVELDETFVGGKNKNRHWNKKAKKCQGRAFVDKVPVLGMLERGGRVICKVVKNTSYKQLTAPILRNEMLCFIWTNGLDIKQFKKYITTLLLTTGMVFTLLMVGFIRIPLKLSGVTTANELS